MQQEHCKHNPKSESVDRWEDLEDEFRASAEAYREVSNELGLAFRHAQGEAYTSYCNEELK